MHEALVIGPENRMGLERESWQHFATLPGGIRWCLNQKPYGYRYAFVDNIEIDICSGQVLYPRDHDDDTVRRFAEAVEQIREAA